MEKYVKVKYELLNNYLVDIASLNIYRGVSQYHLVQVSSRISQRHQVPVVVLMQVLDLHHHGRTSQRGEWRGQHGMTHGKIHGKIRGNWIHRKNHGFSHGFVSD